MVVLNGPTTATELRKQDLKHFILIYKRKEDKYRDARQRLETELLRIVNFEEIEKLKNSNNSLEPTKIQEEG